MKKLLFFYFAVVFSTALQAQSIEEKITELREAPPEISPVMKGDLKQINQDLKQKRTLLKELRKLYKQVPKLHRGKATEEKFKELLEKISTVKKEIIAIEEAWQIKGNETIASSDYGIWHRPDTTLLDLAIDYGSLSYVYLIPPDIAKMKVSVASDLPLPRGSWEDTLEHIFMENGVGVREVTPYLKSLYIVEKDPPGLYFITNKRQDLEAAPSEKRVCFILPVEYSSSNELVNSLKTFINPKDTFLQAINQQLFIVSTVNRIRNLLQIYDFIKQPRKDKMIKVITLAKVEAKDMAEFLNDQLFATSAASTSKAGNVKKPKGAESLKIATFGNLSHSLFLNGSKEEIAKIEDMVKDIESQITDSQQEIVFLYRCKHSTSEDLAKALRGVYAAILNKSFFAAPSTGRLRTRIEDRRKTIKAADVEGNFIIDEKTNNIVMIVEERALPELKSILKQLDKPKKMVKMDILLFEKNIKDGSQFGLNLLNLGVDSVGNNKEVKKIGFNGGGKLSTTGLAKDLTKGVMGFFFSNKQRGWRPAFDLGFSFLLDQDDTKIIANPSVTSINNTDAVVNIKTETSISSGLTFKDTGNRESPQETFTREKYGIDIKLTPTVHVGGILSDIEDEEDFITLKTNIGFDTIGTTPTAAGSTTSSGYRPDVLRRNIENEVTIADGQTVIIGGLRNTENKRRKNAIPFLGEIPGLGKLFGYTSYEDISREMFICITPRIIHDPARDFEKIKQAEMRRRPGDVPEFVRTLEEARRAGKKRMFIQSFRALFGTTPRSAMREEEYSGV